MQTEQFQQLQHLFHTLVVTHASDMPQAATPEASAAAQQWQAVVDQISQAADAHGKRQLLGQLVLVMYYGLFDARKWSAALESCVWSGASCSCRTLASTCACQLLAIYVLHYMSAAKLAYCVLATHASQCDWMLLLPLVPYAPRFTLECCS